MAKEVAGLIKLQIKGGAANPSPPVGPALGSKGINIMEFCKQFNARTQDKAGKILPVIITYYADKSFDFVIKTPPVAIQLLELAKIKSGSAEPNRKKVAEITWEQVRTIAQDKTLVPVIQPPIMRALTTKHERLIRMKPPRIVSHTEKVIFPIVGLLLTCFLVPSGLPLLGMLFFGNLLKESGVTRRLANTASGPLIDVITILLGLTVGASTQASQFLTWDSILIFILGAFSFIIATASGVMFVKFFNLFLKKGNKINPLIGNAGVSAVPDSARISQVIGLEYDPTNYLLMHAMGPNVAGVIGSAVAAGILLGFLM